MKAWLMGLVLANGLVFAWWQGYLSPLVDPPGMSEREPLRLSRQLRPEAVRVGSVRATGAIGASGTASGAAIVEPAPRSDAATQGSLPAGPQRP